ncbi:MAG: hypothetical protein GQ574_11900 [Crocinitomix sp.]|nr:hypothetical protein [Crocinitomix sp.]
MIKNTLIILLIVVSSGLKAQIRVDKFDLTIETELSDTLQKIYEKFLNEDVQKVSIVKLKKKYDHTAYYHFLKNKKFYQRRKKWIKAKSYEGSIIKFGKRYKMKHLDSMVFHERFEGIQKEFIQSEFILDSAETRMAFSEMFNGAKNEIMDMCYIPRHAVVFYNAKGKITGIYEICFECSNVKIGIVGIRMFARYSPYIKSLFEKYDEELKKK